MTTLPKIAESIAQFSRTAWHYTQEAGVVLLLYLLTTRFWVGAFFGLMIGVLIGG